MQKRLNPGGINMRRIRAIDRLQAQLKYGCTVWIMGERKFFPVSDGRRKSIEAEILNIKNAMKRDALAVGEIE
jgi:hypothetical protein